MTPILWITSQAHSSQEETFQKALRAHGYVFSTLQVSSGAEFSRWLADHQGETPHALFVSHLEPSVTKEVMKAARSSALFTYLPSLWVFENAGEVSNSALADCGIEDLVWVEAGAGEVDSRLGIRRRESESRAAAEREIKEQNSRYAKTETTLKQREEFLSVCAHDLRSPLGLIQSSMSMLLNDKTATLSDFHRELLSRAKRQAVQATTLVNDLLDVMAYEQGLKPQFQMIALHDLLNEFYQDYRFQAEQKDVRFHYENTIQDWRVLCDADRIRQLLQNLFTNALKFTERGKNIFLNASSFQGRRKTDPLYPMIVLSLKDEGRGIPQKEIEKIFDRFSQIKDASRAEGRGLGLSVAKQISTSHDGNIWVQSVEGQGSTFFVLFPHVISRLVAEPHGAARKVLVVEPSAERRDGYFRQMESWGYELVFARDGVEAITLLFHHQPELVILNPGLLKIGEAEVANIVKSDPLTSSIPLLFAVERGQKPQKSHEQILVDGTLRLPFSQGDLQLCLKDLRTHKKAA